MSVRAPAVAGMFYAADPAELRRSIDAAFSGVPEPSPDGRAPKAIIVPHAGYAYSGPVAAGAYRLLEPARRDIRRVVLLGPAHRVPLRGLGVGLEVADCGA